MRPRLFFRTPRRSAPTPPGVGGRTLAMAALLGVMAIHPAPALAQEEQTFDDWTLSCGTPQGAEEQICQIGQIVKNKESQKPVLAAVVVKVPGTRDAVMRFTVPLGVILPPGIRLNVDDSEEIGRAPYLVCTPQGCTGIWKLEDQAVAAFKKGLHLKVVVMDGEQRPIAVAVSLRGFTAAYNALLQKGS